PACNRHSSISQERESDDGAMFRGQVDKYTWVDLGSSYLPSDLLARVRTVLSHVLYAAVFDGSPRFVDLPIERAEHSQRLPLRSTSSFGGGTEVRGRSLELPGHGRGQRAAAAFTLLQRSERKRAGPSHRCRNEFPVSFAEPSCQLACSCTDGHPSLIRA